MKKFKNGDDASYNCHKIAFRVTTANRKMCYFGWETLQLRNFSFKSAAILVEVLVLQKISQ